MVVDVEQGVLGLARRMAAAGEDVRRAVREAAAVSSVAWTSPAAEDFRRGLAEDLGAGTGVATACEDAERALRSLAAAVGGRP